MPAGWLANRNALLCVSCGALVLLGHLRWRQRGLWRDLGAALLALALGLLAGEATLGILAYVAAWELTQPAPRWARKLMALLPYGIIVVAWRLLYDGLGYGTYGSQLYLDPVHQPWSYLGALIERWPLLFFAQWSQAPVDLWLFLTRDQQLALLAMVVPASAAVTAFLWPAWRHDRLVRFWLIGMALSLVPLCAAFPMDRLLIFAGIGGFGALATIAISATAPGHGEGRVAVGAWRTTVARVLLALHLPIAAGLLLIRTAGLPVLGTVVSQGARESPADDAVSDQLFVFVNGFDFAVGYTWILRSREGSGPAPDSVTRLASMATDNAVSREDERTLVIAPTDGFISAAIDGLLLNPDRAFHPGEVITRTDFQAEIRAATSDGRPTVVAFRFHLPLEDSRYRFLFWENGRITELPLPAVGQQILIRRSLPSWSES
ncbi:MAG: hypothetical protein HYV63_18190 [Candidatus Schekmanbacteria bacterium]|nr:hypothetical protein [Candidatus Schekmanbacteria bacterium]